MQEEIKQMLVEFGMALATKCMISNNWDIDMTEFVEEYSKSFPMDAVVKVNFAEELQKVINVIDNILGDTDPEELDPDFTEDELIDEFPIVYCFQKLNEIKSKISA